jgi:hypothetical protein
MVNYIGMSHDQCVFFFLFLGRISATWKFIFSGFKKKMKVLLLLGNFLAFKKNKKN